MKKKFKVLSICLISICEIIPICLGVVLGSLNSNNETQQIQPIEVETGLKLSESEVALNINASKTLTASTDIDDTNYIYQWNSSDKKIATIKKDKESQKVCVINAVDIGNATITVNLIDKNKFKVIDSASCSLSINNHEIVLSSKEVSISLDDSNTATVTATAPNQGEITWSSEDETIATVDNGVITAYKPGQVYIVAKSGDLEAKVLVKVYKSIFSLETTKIINTNTPETILVKGEIASDAVWSSSDQTIAIIEDGVVTGLKKGMTTISVVSESTGLSSSCVVIVKDGQEEIKELISGKKAEAANNPGNWYYLCESTLVTISSIPTYDNGLISLDITHVGKEDGTLSGNNFFYLRYQPDDVGDVIYKETLYIYSENDALLTINGDEKTYKAGLNKIDLDYTSTSPSEGSPSQIKFKTAGKYYVVPVFEEVSRIEKMVLSHNAKTMEINTTFTLTAIVPNQDNPVIEWVSSNSNVATVDNKGVVSAISKGSTMITATSGLFSATCLITVIDNTSTPTTELTSKNKAGVLASPGQWFYFVDGKSSLYSKPTIDEEKNITLSIEKIDEENKKYVFLRYQPEIINKYKATINIDFAGTDGSIVDINGGDASATPYTLKNGANKYEFTFTSDNVTPFQLKFYAVGNYVVNITFDVVE